MSKPVYKNSAFWLIVVVLLILAALLVAIFRAMYNEITAQIGMKRHPLARRERQFLELVGRQRPDAVLRFVQQCSQRSFFRAAYRRLV